LQGYALLGDVDLGIWIDSKSEIEVGFEGWPEVVHPAEACSKLPFQGRPTYGSVTRQDVQPVCKPAVEIERHGVPLDRPNGGIL